MTWSALLPYSLDSTLILSTFISISYAPSKEAILIISIFHFSDHGFHVLIVTIFKKLCYFIYDLLIAPDSNTSQRCWRVTWCFICEKCLIRRQVLGTKAGTHNLGHLIKLAYCGGFLSQPELETTLWETILLARSRPIYQITFFALQFTATCFYLASYEPYKCYGIAIH